MFRRTVLLLPLPGLLLSPRRAQAQVERPLRIVVPLDRKSVV